MQLPFDNTQRVRVILSRSRSNIKRTFLKKGLFRGHKCFTNILFSIVDNTITGNQWGGIDIRHGGDPVIYHNTVCNGISDGIVIGEEGRGSIENNIITGNCGIGSRSG